MDGEATPKRQAHKVDWFIGAALAVAALGVYLSTLAPTVLEADSGEFQFVAWLPGIAHPTGYPLYTLLGWLWLHLLPVGEVAWRMNLFSTLCAVMTVIVTYFVARRLLDITFPQTPGLARAFTAMVATATFAVTRAFWGQAIIAEVYALHVLFVAGLLWLALRQRDLAATALPGSIRITWSSALLALGFGLALTHHITIILLLPALFLFFMIRYAALEQKPSPLQCARQLGQHLILLLLPLALYLYLPLVAPYTPYAQLQLSDHQTLVLYDNSLDGFWRHITGRVFAGELQPAAVGVERFRMAWDLLKQQVGWVGAGLALTGLVSLWQRRHLDLLCLTGLSFLAIVTFNLLYFIGDVFVLFTPAWLFVCLWLGLGILELTDWVSRRFIQRKMAISEELLFEQMQEKLGQNLYRLVSSLLPVSFFILPVFLTISQGADLSQRNNVEASVEWQEILAQPLPEGAILLSNDRNEMMPMWYFQYVNGRRRDLLGLFPLIVTDPAYSNVGRLLDQALASGRPVYLIKPMTGLEIKADITPEGSLYRATLHDPAPFYESDLILPAASTPSPTGEKLSETIKLLGYDISPGVKLRPGAEMSLTLYWQPLQDLRVDYTSYLHLVGPTGQKIAQSDHLPGGLYYPTSYWQVGETLRDQHRLAIPADAPPGLYQVWAGMYYQPQPGLIEGMGDGIEIGSIAIQYPVDISTPPLFDLPYNTQALFGDTILLLGYDVVPAHNDQLLLHFMWQARQKSAINWTIFIHLLDQQGRIIAQTDNQPRGGLYPTTLWDVDELVSDSHALSLPDDNLKGPYRLIFGLYNAKTGERLLVTNNQGEVIGDHLTLTVTL
jgi:hypothetical protein